MWFACVSITPGFRSLLALSHIFLSRVCYGSDPDISVFSKKEEGDIKESTDVFHRVKCKTSLPPISLLFLLPQFFSSFHVMGCLKPQQESAGRLVTSLRQGS